MKIKILQNMLFIKDELVYQTPGDIKEVGVSERGILIIWDSSKSKSNSNMVLLNNNHDLLWTIESKKYPRGFCPIIDFNNNESEIVVYRRCGIEDKIDMKTGKILKSELVK